MDKKKFIKNIAFGVAIAFIGAISIGVIANNIVGVYLAFFDHSSSLLGKFMALSMMAMIDVTAIVTFLEFKDANKIRKSINKDHDNNREKDEKQLVKSEEKKIEKVLNASKNKNINNKSEKYANIIDGQLSLFENYDNGKEKNKVKVLK